MHIQILDLVVRCTVYSNTRLFTCVYCMCHVLPTEISSGNKCCMHSVFCKISSDIVSSYPHEWRRSTYIQTVREMLYEVQLRSKLWCMRVRICIVSNTFYCSGDAIDWYYVHTCFCLSYYNNENTQECLSYNQGEKPASNWPWHNQLSTAFLHYSVLRTIQNIVCIV